MENKIERSLGEYESKSVCHNYDSLVRELASTMKVDEKFIWEDPKKDFDHEDIQSWIGAVQYKENKAPDIEVNLSADKGKNVVRFETQKLEGVDSVDKKTTKEELIYSMALTEAKMKVVADIAEETYPAVAFQINDYRKEMGEVREEILRNKTDFDSLDNTLSRVISRRGMMVATGLLISSMVLTACGGGVQTAEGYVPTRAATNKPTATEVITKPTTVPTRESTATKEPTAEPTKEVVPTEIPLQIETDLSGTYEEILARVENMTPVSLEDIESGKYAENEQRLLVEGKIAPFSEEAIPLPEDSLVQKENIGMTIFSFKNILSILEDYGDVSQRPFKLADMAMTEIGMEKVLVVGVVYLNRDKSVSFIHYGIQDYKSEVYSKIPKSLLNRESSDIYFLAPLISIDSEVVFPKMDPDKKNRNVLDLFVKYQGPEIDRAAEKWIETGNVPSEFQNKLLVATKISIK